MKRIYLRGILRRILLLLPLFFLLFCLAENEASCGDDPSVIHVYVALCDNQYQGIVPVSKQLGDGDNPRTNLYWGALYGVKTHFSKDADWLLVGKPAPPKEIILERIVFKHRSGNIFLIADAYRGRNIRQATEDFLISASGKGSEEVTLTSEEKTISISGGGSANFLAYIGHNGLMDFKLGMLPKSQDSKKRDAVILACISRSYFREALKAAGAYPLLWTNGLMAPEAYTLNAALKGWMTGKSPEEIRKMAAQAYNQYQKCGTKAALRLFSTGW